MTESDILRALSGVQEPDLGKDIVTLNMVKDVLVADATVSFTIVLTTPACPLKELIRKESIEAIHKQVDESAIVNINFSSDTTSRRGDTMALLPGVKNIIAVVSGKGGVGKSTIAASTAIGLSRSGAKVGLLDADVYGPSIPHLLGLHGQPEREGEKIKAFDSAGMKVISTLAMKCGNV